MWYTNWFNLYMNPAFKIPLQLIRLFSKLIHWKLLCKILHIFAASMGMLQMLPLILENSPFLYTIAIFLNKINLEIRIFSTFYNSSEVWDLKPFYCRLLAMKSHFYKSVKDIFHIYAFFNHWIIKIRSDIFHVAFFFLAFMLLDYLNFFMKF